MISKKIIFLSFFIAILIFISSANALTLENEKKWIEFEARYLQGKLALPDEKIDVLFDTPKLLQYQKELYAIRMLYHCNRMGSSVKDVVNFIEKTSGFEDYYRPVKSCIRDFWKSPEKYWKDAYKFILFIRVSDKEIPETLQYNPTYQFLRASETSPINYEEFYFTKGIDFQASADYIRAVDVYGRLINKLLDENPENNRLKIALYLSGLEKNDREQMKTLYVCTKDIKQENPFSYLYKQTNSKNFDDYKEGTVPCIDAKQTKYDKKRVYATIYLALRSATFNDILRKSERKVPIITEKLKIYSNIIEEIETLEAKYKNSVVLDYQTYFTQTIPSDPNADNAVHRLVLLQSKIYKVNNVNPRSFSVAHLRACGSYFTTENIASTAGFVIAGALAMTPAAPVAAGYIVTVTGATLAVHSGVSIVSQWENIDSIQKTEIACSMAIDMVLGGAGAKAIHGKISSATAIESKKAGINKNYVEKNTAVEKDPKKATDATEPSSEKVPEYTKKTVDKKPLDELLERVPDEKKAGVNRAGRGLGYGKSLTEKQTLFFKELVEIFNKKDLKSVAERASEVLDEYQVKISEAKKKLDTAIKEFGEDSDTANGAKRNLELATKEFDQVLDVGALFVAENLGNKPASMSIYGRDRSLVKAFFKKALVPDSDVGLIRQEIALLQKKRDILVEVFKSKRFKQLLTKRPIKNIEEIYKPEEIEWLNDLSDMNLGDLPIKGQFSLRDAKDFKSNIGAKSELPKKTGEAIYTITQGRYTATDIPEAEFLFAGSFQDTFRVDITLSNGKIISIAGKSGFTTPGQLERLHDFSKKGLMQEQYNEKPIEIFDKKPEVKSNFPKVRTFYFEEYIPNKPPAELIRDAIKRGDLSRNSEGYYTVPEDFVIYKGPSGKSYTFVDFIKSIADLDSNLLRKIHELDDVGNVHRLFNRDLNLDNLIVYEKDGKLLAKYIDFDPRFDTNVALGKDITTRNFYEDVTEYSMTERLINTEDTTSFDVTNYYNKYLDRTVEVFNGVHDNLGLSLLRLALDEFPANSPHRPVIDSYVNRQNGQTLLEATEVDTILAP